MSGRALDIRQLAALELPGHRDRALGEVDV